MTPLAPLPAGPATAFPDPASSPGRSPWQQLTVLLQREWLQQRTGWLVMLAAPTLVLLAAAIFSVLQIDLRNDAGETELKASSQALLLVVGIGGVMMVMGLAVALMVAVFQAGSLARRDAQDRSIEFWRSLPVSDSLSLAAPMLAHLLLLPLAAMAAGLLGSLVVSLVTVVRTDGLMAWLSLPWGLVLGGAVVAGLRLALGLVLALVWLSPLVLGVMAASAWLKRWGMPAVAAVLGLGGLVLDKLYGLPVVWQVLGFLFKQAAFSFVAVGSSLHGTPDLDGVLHGLPGLALADAGRALASLAQPALLAVLACSAGLFALLLWRRRRAG